jgi:unsaturated chondroitin disaccharide hydrolase
MLRNDTPIRLQSLVPVIERMFELSGQKIAGIQKSWDSAKGSPVFTVEGKYTSRGWTEWTQGFQFGSAVIQYEVTGEKEFLTIGRDGTLREMPRHISHVGVHDHGFNTISTCGTLLRLMREKQIPYDEWEKNFYELAIKVSGAVQAARWTDIGENQGYIYSFNGPHSLFADTIRSLRVLAVAHQLGHVLMGEKDRRINLLERLLQHAETTARFNVYFGEGRDSFDVRGRVAHESIFNTNDGSYRCASTQQGYSPFTTWTRGLAWIMLGYAEELEFLLTLPADELAAFGGRKKILLAFENIARATSHFYLNNTPTDGVPYWDTGAPGLSKLGTYFERPADPFNEYEPVDSSAAAIAAQAFVRLGNTLISLGEKGSGEKYLQAGLALASRIFQEPYLSVDPNHEGLILHSVYHRPNGWDNIPAGKKIPCGESTMWGDYHARELGLLILRMAKNEPYYTFFLK